MAEKLPADKIWKQSVTLEKFKEITGANWVDGGTHYTFALPEGGSPQRAIETLAGGLLKKFGDGYLADKQRTSEYAHLTFDSQKNTISVSKRIADDIANNSSDKSLIQCVKDACRKPFAGAPYGAVGTANSNIALANGGHDKAVVPKFVAALPPKSTSYTPT